MAGEAVDFYFAAMSPYSWFAAERIEALLPQAAWRPVTAAFIFKDAGRVPWGLTDRRDEGMRDCEARSATYGLGPISWPDPWPSSDVDVARAMTFADEQGALKGYALAAMRLCFQEAGVLSDRETLAEAARRSGVDEHALLESLDDEEIKAALRERTQAASGRGVFGVPTVAVGEQLFWGDDRLEEAAAAV